MQMLTLAVITVGALVLFATEKLRADLIAVIVTLSLALTGLISIEQAFSGFSSPAVITVAGIFVMSTALVRTGGADQLSDVLRRIGGRSERRLIGGTVLLVGVVSAFMNNIGATMILMPAVMSAAKRSGVSSGRLLIPLAFGSLLGGLTTSIGTPPNVLISMALADHGHEPFRLFDFAPTGLAVLGAGALFLALAGPKLLPAREPVPSDLSEPPPDDRDQSVSTEVVTPETRDARRARQIAAELGLTVLAVLKRPRRGEHEVAAASDGSASALLVEGARDDLLRAVASRRVHILPEVKHPPAVNGNGQDVRLLEATLAPRSTLSGKTLKELDFYHRYGLTVIGIRRHGESIREPLAEVQLTFGDTLLLRGPDERIRRLKPDADFLLMEPIENPAPDYTRTSRAVAIFLGAIALATVGGMHISLAATLGAVAMVLTGCLRIEEAHRAIDWRTLIAIGGMMPLGTALETTGAAERIAHGLVAVGTDSGPMLACALIGIATVALTQVLTNAAAAILVAPVALSVAAALGVSPYPLMMIVAIAASTAFVTPIGHQSNLLVYSVGGYRFADFVRVGLPLTLLVLAVSLVIVPLVWPFWPGS